MRVKLTKLSDNETALRTNVVEGESLNVPTVGQSFRLIGLSLTPGLEGRYVTTSTIKEVEEIPAGYIFQTLNSKYKLEIL